MGNDLEKARNASTPSSRERADHREWIGGRAATLLSHYWREDDDPALLAAVGRDWADVLEGIPAEYIQRACLGYLAEEPRRKPTPGAILQRARAIMPPPRVVYREPEPETRRNRVTAERAAQIIDEAGFGPRVTREGGEP